MPYIHRRTPPRPGPGFDIYWRFAAERQKVYRRRLEGLTGPALTSDTVLQEHRFTNAYRASDRVSQYLITDVIYDKERNWVDTFVRVLVFKVFNRIDTWQHLQASVIEIDANALLGQELDNALDHRASRGPIYNAAYIMPPPRNGTGAKFRRHLDLLRQMIRDRAHERIAVAPSMSVVFDILRSYDGIGPFLAYQFLIDLNYTPHLTFSENEYVVAGPGALRGIRKCVSDPGDYSASDIIGWIADQQADAFDERDLEWHDLWGRPLQLIDAQNLFCEVDKYTRQASPQLSQFAPRSRIKQRYTPVSDPLTAWFPPKWGVNDAIPEAYKRSDTHILPASSSILHDLKRPGVQI